VVAAICGAYNDHPYQQREDGIDKAIGAVYTSKTVILKKGIEGMEQIAPIPTLLVIDDDLSLLPFLVDMLSVMTNYRIVTAQNGIEGLIAYDEHSPQCVIVDMKMPELDGAQFVRALRGDQATLNTPIIMLTAMASDDDHYLGLASGVDYYLVKPVEPEALVEAIEHALALSEAERVRRLRELAESESRLERAMESPIGYELSQEGGEHGGDTERSAFRE